MKKNPRKTGYLAGAPLDDAVFRLAVERALNHIIITDPEGNVIYANAAAAKMTGFPKDKLLGKNPSLWGGNMDPAVYDEMWRTIKIKRRAYRGEFRNRRNDGTEYIANVVVSPIVDGQKNLLGFIGTEEDVTREREAQRLKTELVSITAHQLLTPLTAVKWTVALLEKESGKLSDEQKKLLSSIYGTNTHLITIVSMLLNVARMESGTLHISAQRTKIGHVLSKATEGLKVAALDKHISLITKIDHPLPEVSIDPALTEEVFRNLIHNAIKYTPDGGKITVSATKQRSDIVISVADTGIGIPATEKQSLFGKFFRASNATAAKVSGSGLGLYFSKMVIETTGGKIAYGSNKGGGTVFKVFLPIHRRSNKKQS